MEHLTNLTNSTLTPARMAAYHTVDLDWVWTEFAHGSPGPTTSEKSFHSLVIHEGSPPEVAKWVMLLHLAVALWAAL